MTMLQLLVTMLWHMLCHMLRHMLCHMTQHACLLPLYAVHHTLTCFSWSVDLPDWRTEPGTQQFPTCACWPPSQVQQYATCGEAWRLDICPEEERCQGGSLLLAPLQAAATGVTITRSSNTDNIDRWPYLRSVKSFLMQFAWN